MATFRHSRSSRLHSPNIPAEAGTWRSDGSKTSSRCYDQLLFPQPSTRSKLLATWKGS
jgi:hypothetical protein